MPPTSRRLSAIAATDTATAPSRIVSSSRDGACPGRQIHPTANEERDRDEAVRCARRVRLPEYRIRCRGVHGKEVRPSGRDVHMRRQAGKRARAANTMTIGTA